MTPRVTIGLPVYNGVDLIAESIRSVLDQDFTDLELVIADNASTDGTLDVVRETVGDDDRVRVIEQPTNVGAAANYNAVLAAARGSLFRWHAHDDRLEPGVITACVEALDADDDAVLAYTWTRFLDENGELDRVYEDDLAADGPTPHERLAGVVERLGFCNAVFGVIRRDVLLDTAQIAPFPGSDVSLLYELSVRGKLVCIPEPLFTRRPGRSIKANNSVRDLAEWFSPGQRGARLPGLHLAYETVRGTLRADLGAAETARTLGVFARDWPLGYARRQRRRRARRRDRTAVGSAT